MPHIALLAHGGDKGGSGLSGPAARGQQTVAYGFSTFWAYLAAAFSLRLGWIHLLLWWSFSFVSLT